METHQMISFGYTREQGKRLSMKIPDVISKLIGSFYFKNFEWDTNHKQFEVSEDGLTVKTIKSSVNGGRPSIRFGEWLYHKYGDKFECTFRIDNGGYGGLMIAFITKQFNEYNHNQDTNGIDFTSNLCGAYANGYFKIDTSYFKCNEAEDRTHYWENEFLQENGDELSVSCDMAKKIGKIGNYTIELPDCVGICFCSNTDHILTVIEQT